jgi:hypothetical protein
LNDPFELPSLEEIEEMEKQRVQAIESLEIFDHSVKCQRCAIPVPIVGKLPIPYRNRVTLLKHRIDWIESHPRPRLKDSINNSIKQLKQELAELLKEDAKADKLRSLPLYSCRMTGFKFVCSKCYDRVYTYGIAKQSP